ncbi:hypothetical protein Tco_0546975, partial [Tanacetum coccineum]
LCLEEGDSCAHVRVWVAVGSASGGSVVMGSASGGSVVMGSAGGGFSGGGEVVVIILGRHSRATCRPGR